MYVRFWSFAIFKPQKGSFYLNVSTCATMTRRSPCDGG
jgi:hypothetical protein